ITDFQLAARLRIPASGHAGMALVPAAQHRIVVTVFVIMGLAIFGKGARIGRGIDAFDAGTSRTRVTIVLVTAIHATRQPGLGTRLRTITLHQHGAAAATGTVTQRVHATDHGDAVVASLTGVGGRRVHAVRAGV